MSEDLHRFEKNLQHPLAKLFLLLFLNNFTTETITKTISCKSMPIFRNTGTLPCQMMAQVFKIIDQSHGD